jgi:molecular chaperone GrpE
MNQNKKEKIHEHRHDGAGAAEISREEYEKLQARIKELEEMKEKYLRSAADFDNAKKRLMRERDEFAKYSQENLIRHLLPVLDNLERAIAHARDDKNTQSKALLSGVEMVVKQMLETLKGHGLSRFESVGQQFDPHRHEAVAYQQEEGKEDEILNEIEPGYMLHDKLLRAAKVRIRISPHGQNTPASDEKQEEIT